MIDFTSIPRLARSLGRLVEIARTLTKYGLAGALARLDYRFVKRWTRGTELARLSTETREVRIRLALTELGPTFIKFGQVLSTRRDLIGSTLAEELTKLQSEVPADSLAIARATIETELGRPIAECFATFEPAPLASASIAQVHRATLGNGHQVAVKVQRPDIARRIADDIGILAELAILAERFLPDLRLYHPVSLVAEFERVITRELDFRRELRHLQLFRQAFASDDCIVFPEPIPSLSTGRVLTMDFLDGIPFNRLNDLRAAGADFDALARHGARVFLDMVFRDGFFHADPHPGNILYLRPTAARPEGMIGLLDVGMVGRISDRMRDHIERALAAVISKDAPALTEQIIQVGEIPTHFDPTALEAEVADQLAFYHGMPLQQFQLGSALNELTDAIRRYHIVLPPTLALVLRVLVMLEGTGRMLAPSFNLVELLEPYKRSVIRKKLSPKRVWRKLAGVIGDWEDLIRVLPRQLSNVLKMLQRQEMGIQLLHRHLEPSVNRLVFGVMVSALFVGSAMLWAFDAPPRIAGASVFGVLGCAVSAFLGFHLFRAIQHSGRLEDYDEN